MDCTTIAVQQKETGIDFEGCDWSHLGITKKGISQKQASLIQIKVLSCVKCLTVIKIQSSIKLERAVHTCPVCSGIDPCSHIQLCPVKHFINCLCNKFSAINISCFEFEFQSKQLQDFTLTQRRKNYKYKNSLEQVRT